MPTPTRSLLDQVRSLSDTDRQALIEAATPKPIAYTREDAIREINELPQARYINDFDMHEWLDKVNEYDPDRLAWHVRRLHGFGGSEIGALWMSLRDQFHPFSSCTDVVEGKFLKAMPLAPEGNLERGSLMEDPILRVKFRREMTKQYAAEGKTVSFRDDLFPKFMNYVDADPKLSWLVGTPDDIMEINGDGKLIIVDYKAPTSGTIAAYASYDDDDAPVYYKAQLAHYSTIAEKLGLAVSDTMLASLNYDKFEFDKRYIPLDKQFQAELLEAGNHYWHSYVLQGQLPPPSTRKSFSQEVELPQQLQEYAKEYAILSVQMNDTKRRRDQVQAIIANIATPISLDVDVVVCGMVNVEAERGIDAATLESDLKAMGVDTTTAHRKNDWDEKALVRQVRLQLGVDADSDEAMDAFRIKDKHTQEVFTVDDYRLMQHARTLGVNLSPYILSETPKFALSRTKAGDAPALRAALADTNEACVRDTISKLSVAYDETKARLAAERAQAKQARPKPAV